MTNLTVDQVNEIKKNNPELYKLVEETLGICKKADKSMDEYKCLMAEQQNKKRKSFFFNKKKNNSKFNIEEQTKKALNELKKIEEEGKKVDEEIKNITSGVADVAKEMGKGFQKLPTNKEVEDLIKNYR